MFAINKVQQQSATALAATFDLPAFIRFWATEIFLKSWDGFTGKNNNAFAFDDPPPNPRAIVKTQFRFIPHGPDQILTAEEKPKVWTKSVVAQIAYKDNG